MQVTTNNLQAEHALQTPTLRELVEATTFCFPQALTMQALAEKRVIVESRGDPDEYLALANEYDAIGATANGDTLRRKACGMKAAR